MEKNNYPEKMKFFLNKSFDTNKEKIEDLTDEGLNKFVQQQTEVYQNVMSLVEEKKPPGEKPKENEGSENPENFNKAENNEFLNEDLDDDIFQSTY